MSANETVIHIETAIWEKAIALLKGEGWIVVDEYFNFDKGIDFDRIVLEKDGERIIFAWDNWFEGEIYCSADRMRMIEQAVRTTFSRGETNGVLRRDIPA